MKKTSPVFEVQAHTPSLRHVQNVEAPQTHMWQTHTSEFSEYWVGTDQQVSKTFWSSRSFSRKHELGGS